MEPAPVQYLRKLQLNSVAKPPSLLRIEESEVERFNFLLLLTCLLFFGDYNLVLLITHTLKISQDADRMNWENNMAAGGGGATYRSLQVTPTWALATVCFIFISISLVIEHLIHLLGNVSLIIFKPIANLNSVSKLSTHIVMFLITVA